LHGKTIGFTDFQGTFTSVAYPKKPFNQLLSQNDFGQAAGYYSSNASGTAPDVPYVYDEFGGGFEVYNIAAATGGAQATGINNSSNVCGFYIDAGGVNHGWLQIQGHFTVLDYPGSTGTQALGLNPTKTWWSVRGPTLPATATVLYTPYPAPRSYRSMIRRESAHCEGNQRKGDLVGFYGTAPINSGSVATPAK
jgi:hypothetical protein